MRVTLKQIAGEAGVTPMTVSRALRGVGRVNAQTRQKIRDIARRMDHYRTDPATLGSPLCQGQTEQRLRVMLGVFGNADADSEIAARILDGLRSTLEKKGGELHIRQFSSLEEIIDHWTASPDQALMLRQQLPSRWIERLTRIGPVIYAASFDSQPGVDCIYTNEHRSAARILDLLTHHGHRRVTWLGIEDQNVEGMWPRQLFDESSATDRVTSTIHGVRHAAWANLVYGDPNVGSTAKQRMVLLDRDWKTQTLDQVTRDGLEQLLAQDAPPTAIVVSNDTLGLALLKAIRERGLRVPGDLSLVSYGNFKAAREAGLTTVAMPHHEIGQLIPELIERRIANPDALPLSLQLETTLMVRDTVGPAAPVPPSRTT